MDVEIEADNARYNPHVAALQLDMPNALQSRTIPARVSVMAVRRRSRTMSPRILLPLLMGVDVRTLNTPLLPKGVMSADLERPGRLPASDTRSGAWSF